MGEDFAKRYNKHMSKPFDTPTLCLKTTPYQEADLIVSFYSPDHGLLQGIVKGAKKPISKLVGACEPITINHVFFNEGKSLHRVSHYQRLESFTGVRNQLERMAAGNVFCELLRLIGKADDLDSEDMFTHMHQALLQLSNPDLPWKSISIQFHLHMLQLAGYLPSFHHCLLCQQALKLQQQPYFPFYPQHGGFVCSVCKPQFGAAVSVNVSNHTLHVFQNPLSSHETLSWEKAHRFLGYYWESRLERPLKSLDFCLQLLQTG